MEGFADINGTRLYYEIAGDGLPVVLIHGFSLDCRMWDDQFAPFAEHYRVVRYDMRGFGRSAPVGEDPYAHTDDLAALLDYLEISRAAIIGLSMGGQVAVDFALTYPAMTRALVPVDALVGGHQWSAEWNAAVGPVWRTARATNIDAGKALWLSTPLFVPANEQPAVAARLQEMVADYSGSHWLRGDPQRSLDPPAMERLHEIIAPTLVVLGERDVPDFHVIADRLADQVLGAQKIILPGAGHMANMEAPTTFNAAVLRFLATV